MTGKIAKIDQDWPYAFGYYHHSLTLRIASVVSKLYWERTVLLYPLLKSNYVGQNKETKPLPMPFSLVLASLIGDFTTQLTKSVSKSV